jgi:electron transfer flavoprotein alpha subunit
MNKFNPSRPLRVLTLLKQIPKFEEMALGSDGRLQRDGLELHMNDYCRRGARTAIDLARASDGSCTAMTLGPASAESVLREAILAGADTGLHLVGDAFAGSDTLATASALAAAVRRRGDFDAIFCGRNSVDADTGQVPAQLAELLGWPLLTGVREFKLEGETVHALLEHDDEWSRTEVELPAVISCAERLCDPVKIKDPVQWATVDASLISKLTPEDLGPGPWGSTASPTWVGNVKLLEDSRAREKLDGVGAQPIERLLEVLRKRNALEVERSDTTAGQVRERLGVSHPDARLIVVLAEPKRARVTRELLGEAAAVAGSVDGRVVVVGGDLAEPETLCAWGADEILELTGSSCEEDVAAALAEPLRSAWAVLAPGTAWGREIASRLSARHAAGLTGDAVELAVHDNRLIALKPAFGGQLVAEIGCSSSMQMATVRPGVLTLREPRTAGSIPRRPLDVTSRSRLRILERWREDDADELANANFVIGVGQGVDPGDYPQLEAWAEEMGAVLCATRKVTDQGWMPRARQVGITGHCIAPRLYIGIGTSGKFNHTVGVRRAGTNVGINPDPDCSLWDWCDIGLVGDWKQAFERLVPKIVAELTT